MKKIILKAANTKEKSKKGSSFFYAVVFVAIITVGTTSYIISSKNNAIGDIASNIPADSLTEISKPPQLEPITVPKEFETDKAAFVSEEHWQSDDVVEVSAVDVKKDETQNAPVQTEIKPLTSFPQPTDGKIIKKHSDTELFYSKTMEDWRLHKGCDIASPIGATVKAVADGKVSDCYTDTAHGVTIVIDHGAGIMTRYCNLASDKMVEVGQEIKKNDAIGVVGDTAEFEVADEAHLHFEVIKNGKSVNPQDFFN